ncbi:MAG: AAA family ATPase [Candidatus Peribacteria bacterium]|nr:AAA family ATPase [Candidatus Peribacteria bacterium]
MLARAVAGEADVAFFSTSGSEFMEMLVGMGAAKVRTLFKQAKDAGKAIIFIDEIDAIGKKRGNGTTGGHQEQEQTLNQILTEMDGFENDTNIIVMAATNRPDILDPALLRAGRFDRKIFVTAPTAEERTEIFNYYLKNKKVDKKVRLESLTKRTSGLVGADIENIVNEASLKIAKEEREVLEVDDFEYALEKIIMGPEKKVKGIQEKEKQITAYHELGHALLAHLQPEADPVEKISIVRRGHALGVTRTTPTEDKNLYSKQYLLSELSVMLAGRAAEEVFFGKEEITTGASNDFERANKTIRNMLTKFGMDEELGMVVYEENPDFNFTKPYSEMTAQTIDAKVKVYLENAYKISKQMIMQHKSLLENIAKMLIEKEYISGDEFAEMIDNPEKIPLADEGKVDKKQREKKETKGISRKKE